MLFYGKPWYGIHNQIGSLELVNYYYILQIGCPIGLQKIYVMSHCSPFIKIGPSRYMQHWKLVLRCHIFAINLALKMTSKWRANVMLCISLEDQNKFLLYFSISWQLKYLVVLQLHKFHSSLSYSPSDRWNQITLSCLLSCSFFYWMV